MAGGLFGKPFVFNEKCIVFSIICMILFLYKPNFTNPYFLYLSLFIIFVVAYVAMAWYDYYFDCKLVPLERGRYSLTGKLKPPKKNKDKDKDKDKDNALEISKNKELSTSRKQMIIYGMHLLLIVPLLLYIAYYKKKSNYNIYTILGVLAIFTAGYHGVSAMLYFK